jgi:EpsG family
MAPYFLIFLSAAFFALAVPPDAPMRGSGRVAFILFAILLALMIGFRWEVGGDWSWDTARMIRLGDADFIDYTKAADPGYALLMWLGVQTGFNIWFVHLLGGGIFAYGLWRFCIDQPHPWLCMVVAIPYLVIVVAMGYDRQAVAIGFVMLAMVAIRHRSMAGFAGSMALATTMHLTALTLIPVFLIRSRVNKLWALIVGSPFLMVGYYYSLQESLNKKTETLVTGYIGTGYSSSGAAVRIAMNALPAFLYFVLRSRLKLEDDELRFLDVLALVALAFVGLLYVSPSSTAVDRMALYIIPIQLLVLGRLPLDLTRTKGDYQMLAAGIVVYSATVMFVWLNFAADATSWVPYSLIDADRLVGLSYCLERHSDTDCR